MAYNRWDILSTIITIKLKGAFLKKRLQSVLGVLRCHTPFRKVKSIFAMHHNIFQSRASHALHNIGH